MSFLGTERVRELIEKEGIIEKGDPKRVVCGAYELSLGDEVFITDSKEKKKQFLTQPKEQITINPGQFALLLTLETVKIPINKIAFISIKAGIKLKGLINVSGFHVDPGFRGKLVFSVYNAGASPISLVKGEACFPIWFSDLELTENEKTSYENESHEHKNQDSIPVKYIDALIAGELSSPSVLLNKINSNYSALESKINTLDETTKGKFNVAERDQKANNYIAVTAIGLVIALIIKLGFDFVALDKGYEKGLELKKEELNLIKKQISSDSLVNVRLLEKKNLMIEIDSLRKTEQELQTSIKKKGNGK